MPLGPKAKGPKVPPLDPSTLSPLLGLPLAFSLFSESSGRVWRPVPPRSPHVLSQGWGCSTRHMGRLQGSPEEMAQPQGPEPQCPK